jgi:NAD(P)-dependent dehydrogenase (short-subunit alcohol dehydrogenase family)
MAKICIAICHYVVPHCFAADIFEHAIHVITEAEDVGTYSPVSREDLFDVEYWSLEQAKIKKQADAALGRRIALVTGAASGIGKATVEKLLELGAHVVAFDRSAPTLKERAELVTVMGDVTDANDVALAVRCAARTFGGLDIVVSNAGSAAEGRLDTVDGDEALRRSLELNLLSHNLVAGAAADVMRQQGRGGVLLFNASKSAFNQGPGFGPYSVPKAALVALMRQYAVDLGRFGIRANAVNADRIRTGIFSGGVLESRAAARGISVDEYFRSNILSREVTAADVADAFAYLARAQATTGCVVTVDGGNAAAFPR